MKNLHHLIAGTKIEALIMHINNNQNGIKTQ